MKKESPEERASRLLSRRDEIVSQHHKYAIPSEVNTPKRFSHCVDFKAVSWVATKNKSAFDACVAFAAEPAKAAAPLLMGPSGCGKTHLLWATVHEVVNGHRDRLFKWSMDERGSEVALDDRGTVVVKPPTRISVIATNGAEVAHELRGSVKNDSIDAVVGRFRQTDAPSSGYRRVGEPEAHGPVIRVLFIDDIEIMKIGDWLAEELYRIIDYRYAENLPTMFVSNLSAEELRNHIGDRIARRMLDMTKPIVMR